MVATGPKVIAMAARVADRLTFAGGADPERVRWAIEAARTSRADAGLDPNTLSLGAYVNVVAHPDAKVALDLATPALFSFARFSAMHGSATGALGEEDRRVIEQIPGVYDMNRHFRRQQSHADVVTPEFATRFGAVAPPAVCLPKLEELATLALDRLVVVGPSLDTDPATRAEAEACFLSDVAPALRGPTDGRPR